LFRGYQLRAAVGRRDGPADDLVDVVRRNSGLAGSTKVGDIVFFHTTRPGPSHAGVYAGNSLFVHAASGFGRVRVTSMDYPYYTKRYLGARRF
jgi:cell wall-associated NlpC family hydrolase